MLKIKKKEAPSEEETPEIPSDDASSVPSGMDTPPMGGGNEEEDNGGMTPDGGMGDGEGNVPDDMPGDGPGEMPSDSMGDDGMDDAPGPMNDGGNGGGAGGEIESIVSQLSPEDQKAVRSYAQSMLDRSEGAGDEPVMEAIRLKKSQIRGLAENFGPTDDELKAGADERKPLNRKVKNTISKKSPFKNPDFE